MADGLDASASRASTCRCYRSSTRLHDAIRTDIDASFHRTDDLLTMA